MTKKMSFGAGLIESMRQAVAIERGEMKPGKVTRRKITAREAKAPVQPVFTHRRIKHLRKKLEFSQPVFAYALNVSPETVKSWEQGKNAPSGPAVRLLEVAERHPEWLYETVGSVK